MSEIRIRLLIEDYNNLRDDERYFTSAQGNILYLGLTVLAALFFVVKDISDSGSKVKYPDGLVAAMPLVVLAFLAFSEYLGAQAIIRSFYARALERELRGYVNSAGRTLRSVAGTAGLAGQSLDSLRLLSFTEFQANYSSMNNFRSFGFFLRTVAFGALSVVFGGLSAYLSLQVGWTWRIPMWLFYGPVVAVILWDNIQSTRGKSFFAAQRMAVGRRLGTPLEPVPEEERKGRSLLGYLVLPRPDDLITKSGFTVAGTWLGAIVSSPQAMAPLIVLVVSIEFLAYQARYQWNDIRGADEDQSAPCAAARGRLPGGAGNIPASFAAMVMRIALVGWAVALIDDVTPWSTHACVVLAVSVPAVFSLALVYEALRATIRRRGCSPMLLGLVLSVVSLGYPLRFWLGWSASGGTWSVGLGLTLIALSALGVLFVSLTWVLEAFSYVVDVNSDEDHAYWANETISGKDHLRRLALACGFDLVPGAARVGGLGGKKFRPVGLSRQPALWVVAGVLFQALIPAGIVGLLPGAEVGWSVPGTALVVILLVPLRTRGSGLARLTISTLGFASIFLWNSRANELPGWLLILVFIVMLLPPALILVFRSMSYDESRDFVGRALEKGLGLCSGALFAFLGPAAARQFRADAHRDSGHQSGEEPIV